MLVETDECQIMPFTVGTHGYVALTVNRKSLLAHRYVCEAYHGSSHLHAAHSCGNKTCMNKRHIRWATRKENEADKLIHGRRQRGPDHPNAKLSTGDVAEIRTASGNQRAIAEQYGIAQQTVSDIKRGRRRAWA